MSEGEPQHSSPEYGRAPEDLTDQELYDEFQFVKENGSQLRLDEVMLEITQRWEDSIERGRR